LKEFDGKIMEFSPSECWRQIAKRIQEKSPFHTTLSTNGSHNCQYHQISDQLLREFHCVWQRANDVTFFVFFCEGVELFGLNIPIVIDVLKKLYNFHQDNLIRYYRFFFSLSFLSQTRCRSFSNMNIMSQKEEKNSTETRTNTNQRLW
jgi:hypothetical protein